MNAPTTKLVPVAYTWGWGFFANALLGLIAVGVAARIGGRIDDLPADLGKSHYPKPRVRRARGRRCTEGR